MFHSQNNISKFFVAGINYKKTDASIRGQFAINNAQYANIAEIAPLQGISEFFILSTCNRTEIYGFAEDVFQLVNILCSQTEGSMETFVKLCYIKQGTDAVQHIFEVGAGLESQILGDYEIIGQIKLAVKQAKQSGFVGAFTERLINCVLQSTKIIKNQTALSGGTVSVSFAAVQYIKRKVTHLSQKNILLLGVGKIGRNTCKNMVDYLGTKKITLINRTGEKASELAKELGLKHAPLHDLAAYISSSDIIVVATNSTEPTILKSYLENKGNKIIIDLSVPYNVEAGVQELPNVTLVNVDELSKLRDETLQKRLEEVPKAKEIISDHKAEFLEWAEMRRNAPVIKAVKQKLFDMHQCRMFLSACNNSSKIENAAATNEAPAGINQYAIHKVIKNMAVKMRRHHQPGCSYIEAINDFITTHRN